MTGVLKHLSYEVNLREMEFVQCGDDKALGILYWSLSKLRGFIKQRDRFIHWHTVVRTGETFLNHKTELYYMLGRNSLFQE